MKMVARASGKSCTCCMKNDRDKDLAQPAFSMAWARYVEDEQVSIVVRRSSDRQWLVSDGSTCWYCFRGWNVIWKHEYTLAKFKEECIKDHTLMDKSSKYTLWIVEQVVIHLEAGGSRDSLPNFRWPKPDTILMMKIVQIELEAHLRKPSSLSTSRSSMARSGRR